jgi:hypothetical protein
MKKAKITFYSCHQDWQEYGSDDETMVSHVFFNLEIGGEKFEGLYSELKRTVGSEYNYETAPILEVSPPQSYEGALNYHAFRACVEKYYRTKCVGSQAKGINLGKGAKFIRMYGNVFNIPMVCEFDIEE